MNRFGLFYENPIEFIICQWQSDKARPNLKYLVYRSLVLVLFVVTWVLSITKEDYNYKWSIYVTNWGYSFCTIQVTLVWIMLFAWTLAHFTGREKIKDHALKMYPAYWLTNTLATPLAFGITAIYWIDHWPQKLELLDFLRHGNNSIIMFIDFWLAVHKLSLYHSLYSAMVGITYSTFTYIYFKAGGTNREGSPMIYTRLNWGEHPYRTLLICCCITCFLVSLHIITALLCTFRSKIAKECHLSLEIEHQISS